MSRVYLLTGAAGFLGGEICRQLIDRHCTVRAFVLPNDPAAKYLPAGVEICAAPPMWNGFSQCRRESTRSSFIAPAL